LHQQILPSLTVPDKRYLKISSESDVLFYFLPNTVLAKIFSQYLSFEDVSRFDVAICNKRRRAKFLVSIRSEYCIWLGDATLDYISSGISWLATRSIKIQHLKCSKVDYDIAEKIGSKGTCLLSISIGNKIIYQVDWLVEMTLAIFFKGCHMLQCVNLSEYMDITDFSLVMLGTECPNLESLVTQHRFITPV
jgi:hypothetical protein